MIIGELVAEEKHSPAFGIFRFPKTGLLEPVFTNSTFLEIPIRFLGLKNFSERIQSLQVVGIPIGIPRNSGY